MSYSTCIRPGSQVVRHSSAKGIYGGSIPPQASIMIKACFNHFGLGARDLHLVRAELKGATLFFVSKNGEPGSRKFRATARNYS